MRYHAYRVRGNQVCIETASTLMPITDAQSRSLYSHLSPISDGDTSHRRIAYLMRGADLRASAVPFRSPPPPTVDPSDESMS